MNPQGDPNPPEPVCILLVEDNPTDAALIQEILAAKATHEFDVHHVDTLRKAEGYLDRMGCDIVLLDLNLPDGRGLEVLDRVQARAADTPVVIISAVEDEQLALEAVRRGAEDYLFKGQADPALIVRSLRYARERYRLRMELRSLTLTDELTGCNNRRGFFTLAAQVFKTARRAGAVLELLFVDMDNLKAINDRMGHEAGDQALAALGTLLRKVVREPDVVARVGGDEFAVLAQVSGKDAGKALEKRILKAIEAYNAGVEADRRLSVSIGRAACTMEDDCTITEMLARADELMYRHKKAKNAP
ncbi:GGDEF domain-containing response regulator [Dissulfurirhabdus thermomarina]|uniref:GGDEF domain-containing response regulator n=1 Tax=Dissulfurirhabdus thermomarina TaxID=1765737 RepID=A0A6N9TUT9_DISTH|nr:diguanylate cyclase [Dissulfurirhabdus thermomarina]NDY43197.1 GGDEF domain-containing response regulator [Dissulfurirhabdus thermomarina]NMX23354.1 GGDEF domain-containing response regulator [Dissulfurirhabdus thermomarina]